MKRNKKSNTFINKVICNWQFIICYGLLFGGIVLLLLVLIIRPIKVNMNYLFDTSEEIKVEEVSFPLRQVVEVNDNKLVSIDIYMEDYSINEFDYHVRLIDEDGNLYFESDFIDYGSNIISLPFALDNNSKGKKFFVEMTCEDCDNVSMAMEKAEGNTKIEGLDNKTLRVVYKYYLYNNSYYWYIILIVLIALILLSLAGKSGDKSD